MNSTINLLIADTQLLMREGLKTLLSGKPYVKVVGEATYTDEMLNKYASCRPDVVTLDYGQAPYPESESITRLREHYPEAKVLVITSSLGRDDVMHALGKGVIGFLTKSCDEDEVMSAIKAVAKGDKFYCSKVLDIIMDRNTPEPKPTPSFEGITPCDPVQLTKREIDIVRLMAQGSNAQDIAETLCLSVHTVYTHRKNIMRKLDVTSAAEVVLYAINSGLVSPVN